MASAAGRVSARAPRARRPRAARMPRRVTWLRRAVAALVLAAALGAGYMLWFRDSSLVAVKEVRIEGLSSASDPEVAEALERAATGMTTLHLDVERLAAAVREYPTVRSLRASPGFPNTLTITVEERPPVAIAGDSQTPVAADGSVLNGVEADRHSLPTIDAAVADGSEGLDEPGREQATVVGAAPEELSSVVEAAGYGPDGVEVELTGGISLLFGDASRAAAKWSAAARILADPGLNALDYIDLRVPDRPAVGGAVPAVEGYEPAPPG
jgi:cell division protein FtsQ